MCTLNLLQGTEFMPDLSDSVLFLEDDAATNADLFDRDLESLTQLPGFSGVRGIVIGRFEVASGIGQRELLRIVRGKKKLKNLPIIANADFGHVEPKITFPIGGTCEINAKDGEAKIKILKH